MRARTGRSGDSPTNSGQASATPLACTGGRSDNGPHVSLGPADGTLPGLRVRLRPDGEHQPEPRRVQRGLRRLAHRPDRRTGARHLRLPAARRQHHPRDLDRGDRRRPRGRGPGARGDRAGPCRRTCCSSRRQSAPCRADSRPPCSARPRSCSSSCCCATEPVPGPRSSRPGWSPSPPRCGRWQRTRCGRTRSRRSGSWAWRGPRTAGAGGWWGCSADWRCGVDCMRRSSAPSSGWVRRRARRRPGIAVRAGVAAGAMLALMSVWTRWMYGSWDPTSGYRAGDFGDNVVRQRPPPLELPGLPGLGRSRPALVVPAPLPARCPPPGATGGSCRTGAGGWPSAACPTC